jgi:hypothetical protein
MGAVAKSEVWLWGVFIEKNYMVHRHLGVGSEMAI